MTCVILMVGSALGNKTQEAGRYLMDFDVAGHTGRGPFPTTKDKAKAKQFANAGEALEFWRTQSRAWPMRPDGEPNRPLTAFTIAVEEVS